jgi:DNA repair protein RecO (recombination protein O)
MLVRTEGIVLHTLKYTDNSIIAKIFTRDYGITSFMVKGVHGKKSAFRPAYFLPLSLLDMNIYRQEKKSLQSLKEIRIIPMGTGIREDVIKSSVALFMSEVLYKTLTDGYVNSSLFELLKEKIEELEASVAGASFPIRFLLDLSRELGLTPMNNKDELHTVFSIPEGRYIAASHPDPTFHFSLSSGNALSELLKNNEPALSQSGRTELLGQLIQYFHYHIPAMGAIKSQQVLKEVFHH